MPLKETLSSIKDEESKITRQKERLFELYETETITKQEFVERKKMLDEKGFTIVFERKQIEEKIKSSNIPEFDIEETIDSIKNLADIYAELEFDEKRELLRSIISSVVVDKHSIELNLYVYPQVFVNQDCMLTLVFYKFL